MAAGVVDIQAQVESVLGALLKVATAELTKLFESRYRSRAVAVGVDADGDGDGDADGDAGPSVDAKADVELLWSGEKQRSIGVQVDEADYTTTPELTAPPVPFDCDCLGGYKQEGEGVEACLFPPDILLAEENCHEWTTLRDQVDLSVSITEPVLQFDPFLHDVPRKSSLSSQVQEKLLLVQPIASDTSLEKESKKFVCPLILKSESPAPKAEEAEEPVRAEACVSTARGTAYSPSPLDGAATPAHLEVWERVHTQKDAASPASSQLHMKLKLTSSPDQKLSSRCAVQLVDVLAAAPEEKPRTDAPGCALPKDLRRHQGVHTGHRLCCFTPCGDGVWRLQEVVAHSRDGYACAVCGKTFARRKVLRRHERFHTGERPYACSQCGKGFALRKSLRRHLRFHTGERPHVCTRCGKSFRLRDNLKAHLRFHTGEKPFSCASCGKTFRIMRNMEKHKLSLCGNFVPSFRMIAGFQQ